MTDLRCPTDDTLWPLATGETVPAEVRGHVESCSDCRGRLARLRTEIEELRSTPFPDSGADADPDISGPSMAARPALIGKYLVVGELDFGGQSVVYRALHPTLDKELVIKLSREPVDAESDDRDLLIREGKLLASLDHANLARIYDLDFHGNLPFLVMEYVRGQTLADYAASVAVRPREAARIIAAVARALAVVHRRGVIHQDIKPRNIMIDQDDRPRLIDFGLARLRHAWDHADEPFGGTPAFTAPEQARGEAGQVTARSDIFALGGVLYFLLTKKAPFDAPSPTASLAKAAQCDYDRRALEAVLPRRLAAICRRAMAPAPAERYDRAESLADELDLVAAPVRSRRGVLIGAIGLAAGLFGIWLAPKLLERLPVNAHLHVEVVRGSERFDLRQALPLDPRTDGLKFTAHVPAGYAAAMYSCDVGEEPVSLAFTSETSDEGQSLYYPGPRSIAPLRASPRSRTQVVIVVAAPTAKEIQELEPSIKSALVEELAGLEELPRRYAIQFERHGVHGQGFGEARPDPAAKIEDRLEQLRQRLRKHAPVVLGVAFSY